MAAAPGGGAPIVGHFSDAEQGGGRLEAQRGGSSGPLGASRALAYQRLRYQAGVSNSNTQRLGANVDIYLKNLPPGRTRNLFIWSQTCFASV